MQPQDGLLDDGVMRAVVQHAGDEEQGAGGNAVIDHSEDSLALDTLSVLSAKMPGVTKRYAAMEEGAWAMSRLKCGLSEGHGAAVQNGQHGEPLG